MRPNLKPIASLSDRKKLLVRDTILDAAERVVRTDADGDLTMRGLAQEAGVSLSTLFNHFGSKGGIIAGLSDRMLDAIEGVYGSAPRNKDPVKRIFAMGRAGVELLLTDSRYYRYICRAIAIDGEGHEVFSRRRGAEQLWIVALESDQFLRSDVSKLHDTYVPQQLGVVYRGVLTMWIAGEIVDTNLSRAVETSLAGVMLGMVEDGKRPGLVARMTRF